MSTNPMIDSTPRPGDPTDQVSAEFAYLYCEGYEAGYAQGREAGYRQGYEAGFGESARRDQAATEAPAKVAAIHRPGRRLLGLPCPKCGTSLYSDEKQCPRCFASQAASARPGGVIEDSPRSANSPSGAARVAPEAITTVPRPPESRLLGLPCEKCGAYFYIDEPQCPHCKAPNADAGKTA